MELIDGYLQQATEALKRSRDTQGDKVAQAARYLADVIEKDGVVHVFGTGGHSNIGAEEMFWRAGGLVQRRRRGGVGGRSVGEQQGGCAGAHAIDAGHSRRLRNRQRVRPARERRLRNALSSRLAQTLPQ